MSSSKEAAAITSFNDDDDDDDGGGDTNDDAMHGRSIVLALEPDFAATLSGRCYIDTGYTVVLSGHTLRAKGCLVVHI